MHGFRNLRMLFLLHSIGQSSQRAFLDSWEGEDTLYFLVEGLQGHIAEAHVG